LNEKAIPIYASSYQQDKKLVTVVVNNSDKDVNLDLEVKGQQLQKAVQTYVTSAEYSLAPYKQYTNAKKIHIPAKSITTVLSN
jgi:O-glycosyl hydrolase